MNRKEPEEFEKKTFFERHKTELFISLFISLLVFTLEGIRMAIFYFGKNILVMEDVWGYMFSFTIVAIVWLLIINKIFAKKF